MNQTTKHSQATIRKIIAIMITSIVLFSLLPTNIILAENSNEQYTFKDTGGDSERQVPFEVEIPPGQKTFEVVTLCGGGNGGLENTLIIE